MMTPSVKLAQFFLAALFLLGCDRTQTAEGIAGRHYRTRVSPPAGAANGGVRWNILRTPESSRLRITDMVLKDRGREMIFSPDVPGSYGFVVVFHGWEGEEIGRKEFAFSVAPAPAVPSPEVVQTPEVAKAPPDDETTGEELAATGEAAELIAELHDGNSHPSTEEDQVIVEERSEAPKPSAQPSRPPKKTSPKPYTIQTSSWPTLQEALAEGARLTSVGLDPYVEEFYRPEEDALWYRVRVGLFDSPSMADAAANELSSVLVQKPWIIHSEPQP